jgi:hypothetical protein
MRREERRGEIMNGEKAVGGWGNVGKTAKIM